MGQQQVLLLALIFCILGIIASVGLINLDSQSVRANRERIIDELYRLASQAQLYYNTPFEHGGGDNSFIGVPRGAHGISKLGGVSSTPYGEYFVVEPGNAMTIRFLGVGVERGLNPSLPVRFVMTVWSDSIAVSILN